MSRLPFELFLALRYLRPKRTSVSVITLISILGVMLGVAVLIIVIAVMSGFDREWHERILGFNGHRKIGGVRALKDARPCLRPAKSAENGAKCFTPCVRGEWAGAT